VTILVRNLQEKIPVEDKLIDAVTRAARILMESERCADAELSIVFVDDKFIRDLNRRYRGIDAATDVLSFTQSGDENAGDKEVGAKEYLLGDVVVSLERANRQAGEYGHSFYREAAYLVVHGTLHLLGYHHDDEESRREMRAKEEAAMAQLGLMRE